MSVVVAAFSLTAVAQAAAAPAHPPGLSVGRPAFTDVIALAGPHVAWAAADGIRWSAGGRSVRIGRLAGSTQDGDLAFPGLAGSPTLVAWQETISTDERLYIDEDTYFGVHDGGKTSFRHCGGSGDGVDVSGRVVVLGSGCGAGGHLTVLDYRGRRKPKRIAVKGEYPMGPVQIAGHYVAWREYEFFIDHIVVYDWVKKKQLYDYTPPDEAGLTFDVQSDGKLAVTYQPDRSKAVGAVGWVSRAEQRFHPVAGDSDFSGVFIRGNRIAYARVGVDPNARTFPFALSDLNGTVVDDVRAPRGAALDDFDGQCVAWSDSTPTGRRPRTRITVTPVPAAASGLVTGSACGLVVLPAGARATRSGRTATVALRCRVPVRPGCSGRFVATDERGHRVGAARFRIGPRKTIHKRFKVAARALRSKKSQAALKLRLAVTVKRVAGVASANTWGVSVRPKR